MQSFQINCVGAFTFRRRPGGHAAVDKNFELGQMPNEITTPFVGVENVARGLFLEEVNGFLGILGERLSEESAGKLD